MINYEVKNQELANHLHFLLEIDGVIITRLFRLFKNGNVKFFYLTKHNNYSPGLDFKMIQNILESHRTQTDNNHATLVINNDYTDFRDIFLFDFNLETYLSFNQLELSCLLERLKCAIDIIYILKPKLTMHKQAYHPVDYNNNCKKSLIENLLNLSKLDMIYLQKLSTLQSTKEMADMFDVSSRTLEKKISELTKKLNVANKAHLQVLLRYIYKHINNSTQLINYKELEEV